MTDTIAAIATAPGRGGIGIIRLSGPQALMIGQAICANLLEKSLVARQAYFTKFLDNQGNALDEGLLLYFQAPNSFTGEDVVELQGHGGPVVLDLILQTAVQQGARLARPGEFSERAFLNNKLDLAQAEAIADLIDAGSQQAARSAIQSLQGAFSTRVNDLLESLITLRLYVEAAIDFPDEEIDFLADGQILALLSHVEGALAAVMQEAKQGVLLRDGMRVVIAGSPNAGKSSLLNALAGNEVAIVTDIAGTTRDVLREHIQLDGLPLHIIDTAGLRDSPDVVEKEGIRRAYQEVAKADCVLFVYDSSQPNEHPQNTLAAFFPELPANLVLVANKCDLSGDTPNRRSVDLNGVKLPQVQLSAKQGFGLDVLATELKAMMGYAGSHEGSFSARRRHLTALDATQQHLQQARIALVEHYAGELAAEDLRLAQQSLSEITGAFTPDDLLGKIFSNFCIGK
ncbi:MAG: tRNA uridine-5-carboxymethylaminomethyl(34) synthesis GTPase MnmE [Moraxellaceae bacterium]|nr:tRNA uridine-5-carboxymethylaminomethyl(34) synthesis GTPase MnmE [Moraxellaceae bacterium]MDZ4386434.1 tRNA uridine-5-carboxymethylaminomethyl(34) synthesis GTPase MnmE [Moraxellaceae bacterium]